MGRTLADAFPQRNVLIVKYGHGGSNLHRDWAAGGPKYTVFLEVINAVPTFECPSDTGINSSIETANINGVNIQTSFSSYVGNGGSCEGSFIPFNDYADGVLIQSTDQKYKGLGMGSMTDGSLRKK